MKRQRHADMPTFGSQADVGEYLAGLGADERSSVLERKDRLVVMQLRRTTGEFFTPLAYASLAHAYLAKAIPDRYRGEGAHHSMYDDFHWWDPCCGTGNLTRDCPPTMKGGLFMSTLNREDVDVIRGSGRNPNAEVFAFDFLNRGERELPERLRAALDDGRPWIFLLNPPYAAGTDLKATTGKLGAGKSGCSGTATNARMAALKLGSACQNIMTQFVFRVQELAEAHSLQARIGLFSMANLWTGSGRGPFLQHFRRHFSPDGGFCFHCSEFQGTAGAWPVVFTTWKPGESASDVAVDVLDGPDTVAGRKTFKPAERPLSKWVKRPKGTVTRPPMNGALGVVERDTVRQDKMPEGALCYLHQTANDVQHSGSQCYVVTGPHESANGWPITPANFHDSMVCFAARKLVKATWLNDCDEFSVPNTLHRSYPRFALDAIVWSMFHGANQTSSLGNVVYKGERYDVPNHLFWIDPAEMMAWPGLPRPTWQQCRTAVRRFASSWLESNAPSLSPDAARLLELATSLARLAAPFRASALPKFQLDRWDAGWYQIRMGLYGKDAPFVRPPELDAAMKEFKAAHAAVGDRLRPMLYALGILPAETSPADAGLQLEI